jgi:putative transposase
MVVVMDLYSGRIVGWHLDKRVTTDLVSVAIMRAYKWRRPKRGIVFHSDRDSQYTSRRFKNLLNSNGILSSMGSVGACWDIAVAEQFFGSLKHDWVLKVHQPTCENIK